MVKPINWHLIGCQMINWLSNRLIGDGSGNWSGIHKKGGNRSGNPGHYELWELFEYLWSVNLITYYAICVEPCSELFHVHMCGCYLCCYVWLHIYKLCGYHFNLSCHVSCVASCYHMYGCHLIIYLDNDKFRAYINAYYHQFCRFVALRFGCIMIKPSR